MSWLRSWPSITFNSQCLAGAKRPHVHFSWAFWGFSEVPKLRSLAPRGGVWFVSGGAKLHVGVDDDFRPARKAHPAFVVDDLSTFIGKLNATSFRIATDEPLDGYDRIDVDDPFGNRIELLQPKL